MKNSIIILVLGVLAGCTKDYQKEGNIAYIRGGEVCVEEAMNHWLLDVKVTTASDSVYLNTKELNRKLELYRLRLDSTTSFYKLVNETCKGDSLDLQLTALEFFKGLGGSVPEGMKENELLTVNLWIRDKLSDNGHIAYKKLFETEMISEYLKQNKWNATRDSATFIYFERLKTNDEPRGNYEKAEFSYTVKALNDYVLAGSQPNSPFIYNPQDKDLLKGIHFLMANLAEGESARAILPSHQAFGDDGNSKVPGFTPIVIELAVLKRVK